MSLKERLYPESKFGGFTDIDGTVVFFNRVNALLASDDVVLDVGCGRGAVAEDTSPYRKRLRILRGRVRTVIGIDVDPAARENPTIDAFRPVTGAAWPVDPDSVDLIVCDNVMEHIEDPRKFFGECRRVLRKGGFLCVRTPNKWSYVAVAAMLIPDRYHSKVTGAVQTVRRAEDVFPTFYRCNTTRRMNMYMKDNGFDCVVYGYEPEPSYLSFSRAAYALGVFHQRFAPQIIKPVIFAFGQLVE